MTLNLMLWFHNSWFYYTWRQFHCERATCTTRCPNDGSCTVEKYT